jgi:hypothetical protein
MRGTHLHLPEDERDGEINALKSVDAVYSHDEVEGANSPADVVGEIGLVLVIALGVALGINVVLAALHIV